MRTITYALWALCALGGCSVIVEGELDRKADAGSASGDAGTDAGDIGPTCADDAQCISFDPFNCNRVCGPANRCIDGPAPDGTRCGMAGSMQHCVRQTCVMRGCGDGFLDRESMPPEDCDDGNADPDDGCNNDCTRSCAPPAPANCADNDPCNGEEACADVGGMMMCRVTGRPLADGSECTTRAGAPGVCRSQRCVAE